MFQDRRQIITALFFFVGIIFIARLFYMQVIDESYQLIGDTGSIQKQVQIPLRGQIYDRNGKLIVANVPVYDMFVTPRKVKKIDTLKFCNLVGIDKVMFDSLMTKAKRFSKVRPSLFLRQLSQEDYAHISDAMIDYQGFHFEISSFRRYEYPTMANALGYVGEISEKQFLEQEEPYYRQGDYIGLSGLEKYYENDLRGERGIKFLMMNVKGEMKGSYQNGEQDITAVVGKNLYTGIDLDVQLLADSLLKNKVGSVIAIEPKTGEIIAMVSAPTYDPALLSGRNFSKNYKELSQNPYKPLLNRVTQSSYRPGSTFKMLQAAIALQDGVIDEYSTFPCNKHPINCHNHGYGPHGNDVRNAVQNSCNSYFYNVFRRLILNNPKENSFEGAVLGLNAWHDKVERWGFGTKLGIDLPSERKGLLPSASYYDKAYGKNGWKFSTIYSLSIGEGELLINPLKIANLCAIIANKGYYYPPHLVRGIGKKDSTQTDLRIRHETGVAPKYFEPILDGMQGVLENGTARTSRIMGINICGKTGTSQNKKGQDHSVFMAFAPREDPKIAVAVFVENAGSGGSMAAPISTLLIEKYLKRKVSNPGKVTGIMSQNFMGRVQITKTIAAKKDSVKQQVKKIVK